MVLDNAVKSLDLAKSQVKGAQLQVAASQIGGSDYVMAGRILGPSATIEEIRRKSEACAAA
jgi:hypothetical protein